jgi:hypothetical protein
MFESIPAQTCAGFAVEIAVGTWRRISAPRFDGVARIAAMDEKDLPLEVRSARLEAGAATPKDAHPTSVEGSGAASAGPSADVVRRLSDLQRRVASLIDDLERAPRSATSGSDARIVIVRAAPGRPEVPAGGTGARGARGHHEDRPRSRAGDRRTAPGDRRHARRERRRGRADPRPVAERVERRAAGADRRCGRGDRRLGFDRRDARPRRRAHRRTPILVGAIVAQALVWAAGALALLDR